MTPVSIAGPSSVQTPAHRPAPSAALRIIGAVALLLAGAMSSEAAARVWGDPVPLRQSADTVSVTLAAPADGTVAEGDTAHFEVGVTGDTSAGAVTVQYAVSGTAKPGEDYAELSGEVTVEVGATTGALIAVETVADDSEDDGETVTITLTNATGPGTVRLRANPRTVRITDSGDRGEPPPNLPPTADAGDDFSADELTVVNLDGSGSHDPDGDDLTHQWTQTAPDEPAVDLIGSSSPYPSFQAPEVAPGENVELTFELVVSDGELDSAPASVTPWQEGCRSLGTVASFRTGCVRRRTAPVAGRDRRTRRRGLGSRRIHLWWRSESDPIARSL